MVTHGVDPSKKRGKFTLYTLAENNGCSTELLKKIKDARDNFRAKDAEERRASEVGAAENETPITSTRAISATKTGGDLQPKSEL